MATTTSPVSTDAAVSLASLVVQSCVQERRCLTGRHAQQGSVLICSIEGLPIAFMTCLQPQNFQCEVPTAFCCPVCSRNIFHMFSEGILAPFQTLREQRLLPLVEVDNKGNVRWVQGCTCVMRPCGVGKGGY